MVSLRRLELGLDNPEVRGGSQTDGYGTPAGHHYFQLRKNSRQVIRISRGPYEGYDVTRLQIWYKDREGNNYKPGRTVAFASEMIPGVIEGLLLMAGKKPAVAVRQMDQADDLTDSVQSILAAHRKPLHWEMLSEIVFKERPGRRPSKWSVYNCLLQHPELFDQVEEDVFSARLRS